MVSKGIIEIKGGINLVNKSTVPELRWIMNNKALCVITMDSGILHVAGTTDCNIVQLGSSINYKLRAPWRNGRQDYKYHYVGGSCSIFCGSDMKYGLREHDDIHGIPPLTDCREEFSKFECHSEVSDVFNHVMNLKTDDNSINLKRTEDGKPAIEIIGDYENSYNIEFIDKFSNKILHQDTINNNMWTCCNEIDKELLIKVNGKVFNVISKDDNVLIKINSNSLGDTIAAIPYIDKYRSDNEIDVSVKMNKKYVDIIKDSYPNLNYVNTEEGFNKIIPINYNFYSQLQEGFALDLGYNDWKYIKPNLNISLDPRLIKEKYAVINVHSTAQLKYWNHPKGKEVRNDALYWTELCIILVNEGITPVIVELNEDFGIPPYLNGLPKGFTKKIGRPLKEVVNYIQHAEFFIGLSSGLAWLAHALNKKVAIIANFTDKEHEIPLNEPDYKRISNESVCNGCFNKTKNVFDISDWEWCPEHKNTDRQFECHTSITPKQVFNEIKEWV